MIKRHARTSNTQANSGSLWGQALRPVAGLPPEPFTTFPIAAFLLAVLAIPAAAQQTVAATAYGTAPEQSSIPPKILTLVTGRGELLQFPNDIKQVAAAEPKIADVVVISPREVMVNAKEVGKTTVVIWDSVMGPIR